MPKSFESLKAFQREHRDKWGQGISLRIHRALSWLKKAEFERQHEDIDGEFIALWISFNAAYASEHNITIQKSEREAYRDFFDRVINSDADKRLYNVIWEQYPTAIRSLMNNPYVFQPYWDYVNQQTVDNSWKDSFESAKKRANQALAEQDTVTSVSILMDRMYTLRNQVIHGGATYQGRMNREQLSDACRILGAIAPVVIELLMQNGTEVWGDAVYFEE